VDFVYRSFDSWVASRQDAKHWSEDELACAEVAWKECQKHWEGVCQMHLNRVAELERSVSWQDHHIWNLENRKETKT